MLRAAIGKDGAFFVEHLLSAITWCEGVERYYSNEEELCDGEVVYGLWRPNKVLLRLGQERTKQQLLFASTCQ